MAKSIESVKCRIGGEKRGAGRALQALPELFLGNFKINKGAKRSEVGSDGFAQHGAAAGGDDGGGCGVECEDHFFLKVAKMGLAPADKDLAHGGSVLPFNLAIGIE